MSYQFSNDEGYNDDWDTLDCSECGNTLADCECDPFDQMEEDERIYQDLLADSFRDTR